MADLDRSGRGKETVAYFIPKYAGNYACFGKLGHHYSFTKENPVKVTLPCDIELFKLKQDLIEVNELGKSEVPQNKTVSETAPPSPVSSIVSGDNIILKADIDKEEDEEDIPIEKPKKKKKKDKELEDIKDKKKKKKEKKEIDLDDDWEEDTD
jgi:hypothetical protein